MRASVCGALLAGLVCLPGGALHARPSEPGPAAPAPPPVTAPGKGALIVALEGTASEAWELARLVYADESLRPPIDDATARVLVGEPPAQIAPSPGDEARIAELAELVASMGSDPDDTGARWLLWSVGRRLGAALVVVVAADAESSPPRVSARILEVEAGSFSAAELPYRGAESGWGDAPGAIRALLPPPAPPPEAAPAPRPEPIAPRATEAKAPPDAPPSRSWYESPWFWGSTGAVAAVGVTVMVLAIATQDDVESLRLQGRAPQ